MHFDRLTTYDADDLMADTYSADDTPDLVIEFFVDGDKDVVQVSPQTDAGASLVGTFTPYQFRYNSGVRAQELLRHAKLSGLRVRTIDGY